MPVVVTGGAVASLGPEEQNRGAGYHIVTMPSSGAACEVAPGVWNSKQTKGQVLVLNTSEVDVDIQLGDVVGGLYGGYVQTRTCTACEAVDHDVILASDISDQEPARCPLPCQACGSTAVECRPWIDEGALLGPGPLANPRDYRICGQVAPGCPYPSCRFCGDTPSYHHGRCCPARPRRPRPQALEAGTDSVPQEESFSVQVPLATST